MNLQKFQEAQALFQQGRKAEAHAILLELSKIYPTESILWLWLAYSSDDLIFARSYLLKLKLLDPQDVSLPGAEKWLDAEEAKRHSAESINRRPTRQLQEVLHGIESRAATPPVTKVVRPAPIQKVIQPPPVEKAPEVIPQPVPVEKVENTRFAAAVSTEPRPASPRKKIIKPAQSLPVVAVTPVTVRRRTRWKLIISLVFLLIFLGLGGGIVAAITMNPPAPDSLKLAGLPVYSSATRLTLTPQDRDALIKGYAAGQPDMAKKLEFECYRLKKSDKDNALNFYDTALRKIGWTAPPRNSVNSNSFNLNSYQKNKQLFFVFASKVPADAYPLPSIRSQLSQDDLLLIVFRTEQN